MKKFLVCLYMMFVGVASATTENLVWVVDDTVYKQTTCETGGDLILPSAPTQKYGYTFRGWKLVDNIITGTVTQNGTPTPNNPIYPTFYENNGMILRAIGDIADMYRSDIGKIKRRIGVKVLKGTENIRRRSETGIFEISGIDSTGLNGGRIICSHFFDGTSLGLDGITVNKISAFSDAVGGRFSVHFSDFTTVPEVASWLASQYANGTPVTVYYPLAEPVEEIWAGQ